MKVLFVDGPAEGQQREYPYDTTSIAVHEREPIQKLGHAPTFKLVHYVKFATDHAGRSLFKLESQ